jgi:hypothetical protein
MPNTITDCDEPNLKVHLGLVTIRDGIRILQTIIGLIKADWCRTGLVPRLPTAVLSASLVILSFMFLSCGLILDLVAHGHREVKRLAYLLALSHPLILDRVTKESAAT